MKTFSLHHFPVANKRVIVRVDYDVPIKDGKVLDNSKIKASVPTIKFLLEQHCTVILMSHRGRPNGKNIEELRMVHIQKEVEKLLKRRITVLDDSIGDLKISKGVYLLENLRFYKQERENSPVFAHALANLADVYVNESFATSHRKHASTAAITKFLPSLPGFWLEQEVRFLSKLGKAKKPIIWIFGGAKFDKVDLIKFAMKKADYILVGGALPFAFMRASGLKTGMSKVSSESVKVAKSLLKKRKANKIILPIDYMVADTFNVRAKSMVVESNSLESHIGLDLGPKTVEMFKQYLRKASTIIWTGPLGHFEWAKFAGATKEIGRFIGKLTARSIVGGGDTAFAIHKFHLEHNFTHVSIGGGALAALISGEKLPAIVALERNFKNL